jgi:TPR repeat protein
MSSNTLSSDTDPNSSTVSITSFTVFKRNKLINGLGLAIVLVSLCFISLFSVTHFRKGDMDAGSALYLMWIGGYLCWTSICLTLSSENVKWISSFTTFITLMLLANFVYFLSELIPFNKSNFRGEEWRGLIVWSASLIILLAVFIRLRKDKALQNGVTTEQFKKRLDTIFNKGVKRIVIVTLLLLALLFSLRIISPSLFNFSSNYLTSVLTHSPKATHDVALFFDAKAEQSTFHAKQALKWFEHSHDRYNKQAHHYLAKYAYYGIGMEKDYKKALEHFERVECGDDLLCHAKVDETIGDIYSSGKLGGDTEYELEYARVYYQSAAKQDSISAAKKLAQAFGKQNDIDQEFHWYRIAANAGDAEASLKAGQIAYSSHQMKQAAKYFNMATIDGNLEAKARLSELLLTGQGVEVDINKATSLAIEGAKALPYFSQYVLGAISLEKYKATKQANDLEKAIKLLSSAGSKEIAHANAMLGDLYLSGDIVSLDMEKAEQYLKAASDGGHKWSSLSLANIYAQKNTPSLDKETFNLYLTASKSYYEAVYKVAVYYELGKGTAQSFNKANEYYREAAEDGSHVLALTNLAIMSYLDYKSDENQAYGNSLKARIADGDQEAQYHWYQHIRAYENVDNHLQSAIQYARKKQYPKTLTAQNLYNLAVLYSDKENPKFNPKFAIENAKEAAQLGNLNALNALSVWYGSTKMQHRNNGLSKQWRAKAIQKGAVVAKQIIFDTTKHYDL